MSLIEIENQKCETHKLAGNSFDLRLNVVVASTLSDEHTYAYRLTDIFVVVEKRVQIVSRITAIRQLLLVISDFSLLLLGPFTFQTQNTHKKVFQMETTYGRWKMWEANKIGVINTSDLFIHQKIHYIPVKPREREKRMSEINKSKGYENVFHILYNQIPKWKSFSKHIKNFYFILKYLYASHVWTLFSFSFHKCIKCETFHLV